MPGAAAACSSRRVLSVDINNGPGPDSVDLATTLAFKSTGAMTSNGVSAGVTWMVYGAGGNYDLYATVTSGVLSSGTSGAWLDLDTDRAFRCDAAATISFQVRDTYTLAVLDTNVVSWV